MKKPNILFAIADDASHFGVYGHKMVNTPTIDEIAKEGVIFNNAFTSNPKCAPSRAVILTGKHTWQLQSACTHFCEFPPNQKLYPDLLEDAGYHVGFTGKGWAPGNFAINGYKRNPAGTAYNEKLLLPPNGSRISSIDYAENFNMFLDDCGEQPFCFWYGCLEPHRDYTDGEGVRNGKNLDDVVVPDYLPDTKTVRSDFCDYAFEIDWFDKQLSKMIEKLKACGKYENTIIVVTSDNGCPFPRIKGQMYEDDFKLPLIISWKDGIVGNRIVDDIVSFTDFMPTFLEAGNVEIPKECAGNSLFDILKSDKNGIINPKRNRAFMGRERHDMGRYKDTGYPVRCIRTPQYLYVHNYNPEAFPAGNPETYYPNCDNSPTKQEILLRHAIGDNFYYRLSFGLRPMHELYDILNDSQCMNNLAYEEEYLNIRENLWQELQDELKATQDPRAFGNGDIFDTYKYAGNPPHGWYTAQNTHEKEIVRVLKKNPTNKT